MKNGLRILTVEDGGKCWRWCFAAPKVTSAADGGEALAKIAASEQPFLDILITDHQMPHSNSASNLFVSYGR